jgi:hypothetical protein
MSNVTPFPYAGAIDADGHILEPPGLWEKYIDPKYRDRAHISMCDLHEAAQELERSLVIGENVRQVYGL